MIQKKGKISTRQLMLLFIMSTFSPAIRLFPMLIAKQAKQAGWLTPIFSMIVMFPLIFIVQSFFENGKYSNLSDVFTSILGKFLGRMLVSIYFIGVMVLLALYVRLFAERISSSILPDTTIRFFILVILGLVFYVLRGGIVSLVRTNEFIFYSFMFIFGITSIMAIFNIKTKNLLPISYMDILPVAASSYAILGIWGYFFLMFFFGENVNDKENIKHFGVRTTAYITVISLVIITISLGVLGSNLSARVFLPYFITIKEISVLSTLERMEPIIVAIWIIADFIIISTFAYISVSILKSLFSLPNKRSITSPVILLTYILAMCIGRNRFELETFSEYIALPGNIILCFVIPIIVFIIGKIRKLI